MEKKTLFDVLFTLRHFIAVFCSLVAIFIIKQITLFLYIKPYQDLDLFALCQILWHSNDFFLRLILIFNFFIKPLFIYLAIIYLFLVYKAKSISNNLPKFE